MRLTELGKDLIIIKDDDYNNVKSEEDKIHLIKIGFDDPNVEKMNWLLQEFSETNRFIIDKRYIKFYNDYLKHTNKKYYVINRQGDSLISFFKKNNKVLLNVCNLTEYEQQFVITIALEDVLRNTEVILVTKEDYNNREDIFNKWRGNLILFDKNYLI